MVGFVKIFACTKDFAKILVFEKLPTINCEEALTKLFLPKIIVFAKIFVSIFVVEKVLAKLYTKNVNNCESEFVLPKLIVFPKVVTTFLHLFSFS
jgi:hypothetical protein